MGRTAAILDRTLAGARLSEADAVTLLEEGNLLALGAAAQEVRNRRTDPSVATYIVDRNINYTNVCVYRCQFCAFYRPSAEHPEAYVLSHEQIGEKIQETIDLGGTGVLLQGGVHAGLPFEFYEDMFRYIRTTFPSIHLHALSAPEVYFLQKLTKKPMRDVVARLKDAGLQSIPGGGAEILEDSVGKRIWSLTKSPTQKGVDVHESAPGVGMRTTATLWC
ncbi:MAG: radical SAM protein, partial [Syntrophomonadaceae bacterium]